MLSVGSGRGVLSFSSGLQSMKPCWMNTDIQFAYSVKIPPFSIRCVCPADLLSHSAGSQCCTIQSVCVCVWVWWIVEKVLDVSLCCVFVVLAGNQKLQDSSCVPETDETNTAGQTCVCVCVQSQAAPQTQHTLLELDSRAEERPSAWNFSLGQAVPLPVPVCPQLAQINLLSPWRHTSGQRSASSGLSGSLVAAVIKSGCMFPVLQVWRKWAGRCCGQECVFWRWHCVFQLVETLTGPKMRKPPSTTGPSQLVGWRNMS